MNFKISREYARGGESFFAGFTDRSDAEQFINTKRESDQLMKLSVIYRLYEGSRLLASFGDEEDSSSGGFSGRPQTASSAAGGRGAGSSFQPTPFNSAPRPVGMPQNWVKDEDKKSDGAK